MKMNQMVPKIGAGIVTAAVLLFAVCLFLDFSFGSYLVCMLLPIGYIMMIAGFCHESDEEHKVAANAGVVFAAIYAVLVFLVYFAQTTLRLDAMTGQAAMLLDFKRGGLMFSYDLLGYGMMALSTFFTGLSIKTGCKRDRWLKLLLMIHGVFFFGCFIMPMTGAFSSMSNGGTSAGGTAALIFWCVYFFPIGVLSYQHFGTEQGE